MLDGKVYIYSVAIMILLSCSERNNWIGDQGAPYPHDAPIYNSFFTAEWVDDLPELMKDVKIGDSEDVVYGKINKPHLVKSISEHVANEDDTQIIYDLVEMSKDEMHFRQRFNLVINWSGKRDDLKFISYKLIPFNNQPSNQSLKGRM